MIFQRFSRYLYVAVLCLLHSIALAANASDDVVAFDNGDQLTGEFKSMQRGKVSFNAYGSSTIDLHWGRVANVSIDRQFLVETVTGTRFSGAITSSEDPNQITVATERGPVNIDDDQVASMYPLEGGGLKDLKIYVSAGINYAKANSVAKGNVGVNITKRTQTRIARAGYSSNVSNSSDTETSQRRVLGVNYSWLKPNRWLVSGTMSMDSNDELGIELRTSLGAGGGRILVESDHSFFELQAGLLVTQENLVDNPEDTQSLESYINVQWDWYKFADPDIDWLTHLRVIPSLTESGRVRAELDVRLSWKVIGNLRWQLDLYSSLDNRPQTEDAENIDYGVNTSISYRF